MREHSSPVGGVLRSSTASATEITNEERRTVYEYVVEHGPVRPRRLQEELYPYDRRAIDHHLALLEQNGLLVETDDRVRVTADLNRVAETKTVGLSGFDSPVEFRPATEADRAELVSVIRSMAGEQPAVETAPTLAMVTDGGTLHRRDSTGERAVYVATLEDTICGWVHIDATARSKIAHTATVTGGVVESRREAGIGTRLLAYARQCADRCGYEKLYQHLPATNQQGIDFLVDRGWTIEATRDDHYLLDGSYVDDVILSAAVDR
ncbi:GNAT family N-acetyltransferase [Natrinema sp. 1APR25-10V2]|uniref:GNAT family N-acetyltransferase n=1 Tax=Natrinema sp. 1APR25-10V2 TaxID=2951081 RepID=UPI002875769E|nr:GNAT family N-acetyltransferase [Natrinema sp. 1APR25-10V2]MDS0477274.1 GNAT family N-acetyltransferase [Natrinema sp. 1APR25-10V2]